MHDARLATVPPDAQVHRRTLNLDRLEDICRALLVEIGEDPDRPGLRETPRRFARYWQEFIEYEPGNTDKTFEAANADQLVVVSGVRVYSLCEHHLLPFYVDLSIGYLAQGQVLGLSKFARVAHDFAHRLQIQERMVQQIADEVSRLTGSESVAVHGTGVHLCMVMRGVRTEGEMKTQVMQGEFRNNADLRKEFLANL